MLHNKLSAGLLLFLVILCNGQTRGEEPAVPLDGSSTHSLTVGVANSLSTSDTVRRDITIEEISSLLSEHRFEELESIADMFLEQKTITPDGKWALGEFYAAIEWTSNPGYEPRVREVLQLLELWDEAYPDSLHPRIGAIHIYRRLAWNASASGQSNYYQYATKAEEILKESENLFQIDNPALYSEWIFVGRILSYTEDQLRLLFTKGTTLEPEYLPLFYNMAIVHLPRWTRNYQETERIARQAMSIASPENGKAIYAQIAVKLSESHGPEELLSYFGFNWQIVRTGLDDVLEDIEDDEFYLDAKARFAAAAEDREAASEAFAELGYRRTSDIWTTDTFNQAVKWSQGNAPNPVIAASIYSTPTASRRETLTGIIALVAVSGTISLFFLALLCYFIWVAVKTRRY